MMRVATLVLFFSLLITGCASLPYQMEERPLLATEQTHLTPPTAITVHQNGILVKRFENVRSRPCMCNGGIVFIQHNKLVTLRANESSISFVYELSNGAR